MNVWMKTHPSASLLQKVEILMYYSTLRFQIFLRLAYEQLFIQTQVFGRALNKWRNLWKTIFMQIWQDTCL